MQPQRLSASDVKKELDHGALLVDVRDYADMDAYAFITENRIAMPITEFAARYRELPQDKLLIMACNVGINSLKTGYYLLHMGYENVANLEGGIEAWEAAGFPVKKDPAKMRVASSCCCGGGTSTSGAGCCDTDEECAQVTPDDLNSGGCCA